MTYKVLARKYRPTTLSGLIGQDVLVRTLSNAILTGRIPHAFVLTGIRGVGKTSTARILARSLLCTGAEDNATAPTVDPCGVCSNCTAIREDRHVDVLEMDAASHTGVGDIREIIDNVPYAPVMGRYKIYIIDEVHMLSKSAFNALLKTLEEPPAHTKFIFATTEIRKIPVTILSRCMRFDLARVEASTLTQHFTTIAGQENIPIEESAVQLIATAAEGSVRDGLSLLDQAIASTPEGQTIQRVMVQQMLGMADRSQLHTLFQHLLEGDAAQAIPIAQSLYRAGSSPHQLVQDMLELCHKVTQAKVIGNNAALKLDIDAELIQRFAQNSTVAILTRLWQMLLKGLQELAIAPDPLMALEMLCIRIAYAADVPPPNDLIKKILENPQQPAVVAAPSAPATPQAQAQPQPALLEQPQEHVAKAVATSAPNITDFASLITALEQAREALLASWLKEVQLVKCDVAQHSLEFVPPEAAPKDFATRLSSTLHTITQQRWFVVIAREGGQTSLRDQQRDAHEQRKQQAVKDPMVQEALQLFSGAQIVDVREQENVIEEVTETTRNAI